MPHDDSDTLDSLLDSFDAAWQSTTPPVLDEFLPPREEAVYEAALRGLVRIDLERRLRSGEAARLESYLQRYPELRQNGERLAELVLFEEELRHGLGLRPDPAEYLGRFPELAERLMGHLHTLRGADAPALSPPTSDRDPELDRRDHVLLERVGRGGMGEVFRGRDPALGRHLAVKVLRPELRGHAEAERRFEQEARINGVLQHPSIVPVHNLGRLPDGRLYFTMKLIQGRTLADLLAANGAGPTDRLAEFLDIFEKVCQALAFAHSRGVIHRDLKPANIMVGAFGEVQVMDWGLAKILKQDAGAAPLTEASGDDGDTVRRLRSTGSTADDRKTGVVGTPAYMPPEQARGQTDVDERADVFGLGAMLCEILTGSPPYAGVELLRQAEAGELAGAFARLAACGADAELVQIARSCLAVHPDERPADAQAVAAAVTAYRSGVQERLRRAELERVAAEARAVEAQAKGRAERRARRLLVVAVVLLLAGTVGSSYFAYRAHQQSQEAKAENRRAQNNLQEALAAIDQMLTHVGQERLQHVPQFDEERRSILRDALKFAQRLQAQNSTEPHARLETGKAQARIGDIDKLLGEDHNAEAAYQESIRLLAALHADYPDEPQYQAALAESHHKLAYLLAVSGTEPQQKDQAEEEYRAARHLWDELVQAHPDNNDYLAALAKDYYHIACLLRGRGRRREAEESFVETVRLQLRLVQAPDATLEQQGTLGSIYNSMGYFYQITEQWPRAEETYLKGMKIFDDLAAAHPADLHALEEQAFVWGSLGLVYQKLQRPEQAEQALRKAVDLYKPLVRVHPTVPGYSQESGEVYVYLGTLAAKKGQIGEALDCHTQAIRLLSRTLEKWKDDKETLEMLQTARTGRTEALARLAKEVKDVAVYREAAASQEALIAQFPAVPEYSLEQAAIYRGLGRLLRDKGQPMAALPWYARAITTLESLPSRDQTQDSVRKGLRDAYADLQDLLRQLNGGASR
jgi:serine/threonine protein kinase